MTFPFGKTPLSFSDQLMYLVDDDDEVPFCSKENVADCMSYLNQVFIVLLDVIPLFSILTGLRHPGNTPKTHWFFWGKTRSKKQ